MNETTRHADVILPGARRRSRRPHYDLALYQLAVRNVANYSPPILEPRRHAGRVGDRCCGWPGSSSGQGPDADVDALDDMVIATLVAREVAGPTRRVDGPRPGGAARRAGPRRGPERLLDLMLRTGPYGDGFGADPDGLTLDVLERDPHGIDLGPLRAAAARGAAHGRRARSSSRPSRSWPTSPRLRAALDDRAERRHRARRPPPAALQQLVDAQPAERW